MRPGTRRAAASGRGRESVDPDLGGSGPAPPPVPPTASLMPADVTTIGLCFSRLVRSALAEESLRPEDQDQDQDREDDRVRPARRDVLVAPRGEEADQQSAEGGPRHAPD